MVKVPRTLFLLIIDLLEKLYFFQKHADYKSLRIKLVENTKDGHLDVVHTDAIKDVAMAPIDETPSDVKTEFLNVDLIANNIEDFKTNISIDDFEKKEIESTSESAEMLNLEAKKPRSARVKIKKPVKKVLKEEYPIMESLNAINELLPEDFQFTETGFIIDGIEENLEIFLNKLLERFESNIPSKKFANINVEKRMKSRLKIGKILSIHILSFRVHLFYPSFYAIAKTIYLILHFLIPYFW